MPTTSAPSPVTFRLIALVATLVSSVVPTAAAGRQDDSGAIAERVADAVCEARVVLLGERPSHGEARAFQAKAEIVRRLVERCGFGALLFEAPMYDFVGLQEAIERGAAEAGQLDRAIGRFWWTRELGAWRGWLLREASANRLVLGGLDDQVSVTSEFARAALPGLVAAWSAPRDRSACEEAVARHLYWRYDEATPFDDREKTGLQRCVRAAATAAARAEGLRGTPRQAMLESFAGYVDRQRAPNAAPDRDEAMARNARWHLDRLPRDARVIVWTATVHAARTRGGLRHEPLGARVAATMDGPVAAIGFTAYAGQSSMAGQPSRALPPAPPGALEARSTAEDVPWAFLDASALHRIGPAPSRLLGSFTEADWSTYFDGVVVIREEVAPVFEAWR